MDIANAIMDQELGRSPFTVERLTYIAATGQCQQKIVSKKVGEVSVTYSSVTSSTSSAQADPTDLTETFFGLQLLSLLKLYSITRYVP